MQTHDDPILWYRLNADKTVSPIRMSLNDPGFPAQVNSPEERIVKQEYVSGYFVSTVFLQIDHALFSDTPVLFETLVFGDPDERDDMERYHTYAEACEGHQRFVDRYRQELWPWVKRLINWIESLP